MVDPARVRCYTSSFLNFRNEGFRKNTALFDLECKLQNNRSQYSFMQTDYSLLQSGSKENRQMTAVQDIRPGEVSVNYDYMKKKEEHEKHCNLKSNNSLFEFHPSISKKWGFYKNQLKDINFLGNLEMEPNYENSELSVEPRECVWSEENCHEWRTGRERNELHIGKLKERQSNWLNVIACDWGAYSFKQELKSDLNSVSSDGTGINSAMQTTSGTGINNASQPTSSTGINNALQPTSGTVINNALQPTFGINNALQPTSGINNSSQPTTGTGINNALQPTFGINNASQPTTGTGINNAMQPTSGINNASQPTTGTGINNASQPTSGTGINKASQPTSGTGINNASQPTSGTGINNASQPTSGTGINNASQPTSGTGINNASQPTSGTGINNASQPTSDTGINKASQPTSSCKKCVVVLKPLPAFKNVRKFRVVTDNTLKIYYKKAFKYVYLNSPALLKKNYHKTCQQKKYSQMA